MTNWLWIGGIFIGTIVFLIYDRHYWENVKKPLYTEEQLLENIKRSRLKIKSLQNKGSYSRETMDYYLDVLEYWEHEYQRTVKYNEKHNKE